MGRSWSCVPAHKSPVGVRNICILCMYTYWYIAHNTVEYTQKLLKNSQKKNQQCTYTLYFHLNSFNLVTRPTQNVACANPTHPNRPLWRLATVETGHSHTYVLHHASLHALSAATCLHRDTVHRQCRPCILNKHVI